MEKFLDKLGIYDFWTTIVPGLFSMRAICFACNMLFGSTTFYAKLDSFADFIMLFLCAYIMGTILQEIGSLLKRTKFLFSDDSLRNPSSLLNPDETSLLNQAFEKKYPTIKEDKLQFSLISTMLQEKSLADKPSKLNILSQISRSFAIAVFLVFFMVVLSLGIKLMSSDYISISNHAIIAAACIVTFPLFVNRANRFQKMWIRQLYRVFIVSMTP